MENKLHSINSLITSKDENGNTVQGRLGSINRNRFYRIRSDKEQNFPKPIVIGETPYWSEEQIEGWLAMMQERAEQQN